MNVYDIEAKRVRFIIKRRYHLTLYGTFEAIHSVTELIELVVVIAHQEPCLPVLVQHFTCPRKVAFRFSVVFSVGGGLHRGFSIIVFSAGGGLHRGFSIIVFSAGGGLVL